MDDVTRHPADDELFDLVAGALDERAAQLVQRHIARCAACAAFVAAATAGGEAASGLVEPMAAEDVARLDAAVAAAWRERRESIAAAEHAEDLAAPAELPVAPVVPAPTPTPPAPTPSPGRAPTRRARRARWLVPALGLTLLALLAGASVYLGTESGRSSLDQATPGTAEVERSTGSTAPEELGSADSTASAPAAGVDADASASAGTGAGAGATSGTPTDPALTVPPVGLEETAPPEALETACVATFDPASVQLPGGRAPTQVLAGPLGLYVACG